MNPKGEIYIGTVAMEPNRWTATQEPTFEVSQWLPRFAEAGFDGVELWENHYAKASPQEQQALREGPCPIRIYNTYMTFTQAEKARTEATVCHIEELGVQGVKWNLGKDPEALAEYETHFRPWLEALPSKLRVLAEVHPGTVIEKPEAAETFLNRIDDPRIELIVHGLRNLNDNALHWLERFGDRITHLHLQTWKGEGLATQPNISLRKLERLRELGFKGSVCMEFVEGSATQGESPEKVWQTMVSDFGFLNQHRHFFSP